MPRRSAAARSSGSADSSVWRPASRSRPASIASSSAGRQAGSSLPPVGATPISSVVAPRSIASATLATTGTSRTQKGSTSTAVRPALVESTTATTSRFP